MDLLLSHISFLLGIHRVVPVVGLGTFVRVDRPAVLGPEGIKAPKSIVEFHPEVDPEAPRILEASLVRSLSLTDAEVAAMIDDQVANIQRELFQHHPVAIEGVGTLHFNDGHLQFKAAEKPCWSAICWYSTITATELVPEVKPVAPVTEIKEEYMHRLARTASRTASNAAAIALILLISFITSQLPTRHEFNEPNMAKFGVESIATAPTDVLIPRPGAATPALVLVLNTPSDGVIEPSPSILSTDIIESGDPYILVVASLANEREIARYKAANPETAFGIQDANGRYRMYVATGKSVDELTAYARREDLYTRYPNAWICRR